ASFASAWTERAARVAQDLDGLAAYAESEQETLHLRRARAAFAGYSRIVAQEQALLKRGDRARAVGLSETDARTRITELQENLEGLMAATYARSLGAQAEAARLETRTWTAVLVALGTAVGLALLATAILARHLDLALAGVWTLDGEAKVLELKASAGSCTHLSETHRRVALGQGEIGLIAAERRTHVTSAILQDPRMGDPAWARGEGLVAFVGHPLLVEDRLVGVTAAFARA